MTDPMNEKIMAIIERSMAEADKRRDEIVRRKLDSARESEQKAEFWGRVAGWCAAIAFVGWVITAALLLLA